MVASRNSTQNHNGGSQNSTLIERDTLFYTLSYRSYECYWYCCFGKAVALLFCSFKVRYAAQVFC